MAAVLALTVGCARSPTSPTLPLRHVVLYQSGIGFFERSGPFSGDRLTLRLRVGEVDDVLKTLTVLDRRTGRAGQLASIPRIDETADEDSLVALEIVLPGGGAERDLYVAYAVPTPTWKAHSCPLAPGPRSSGS